MSITVLFFKYTATVTKHCIQLARWTKTRNWPLALLQFLLYAPKSV